MAKNIRGFLENLTNKFLNIIVKIKSSGDLKFEYKIKTKIDRRGHEIFSEKITGPWNI